MDDTSTPQDGAQNRRPDRRRRSTNARRGSLHASPQAAPQADRPARTLSPGVVVAAAAPAAYPHGLELHARGHLRAHSEDRRNQFDRCARRRPGVRQSRSGGDLPQDLFARAYKFTVVRNPWDRLASSFHFMQSGTEWPMQQDWARRHLTGLDFAAFVRKLRNPWFRQEVLAERFFWPQSFWLKDRDGRILVDEIHRFEELAAAVERICAQCGIAAPTRMAEHRKSARAPSRQLYEDDEMIELVGRLYAEDIERFGYSFDANAPALVGAA
ncbi:MAG: hypothetical protein B7Z08_00130 [Sphingomonadales bacterium 32-68-7]|nr:MAG: hypothetical protein B7Z08_00130 [Sphingomonadales bacterium 32-68-7]